MFKQDLRSVYCTICLYTAFVQRYFGTDQKKLASNHWSLGNISESLIIYITIKIRYIVLYTVHAVTRRVEKHYELNKRIDSLARFVFLWTSPPLLEHLFLVCTIKFLCKKLKIHKFFKKSIISRCLPFTMKMPQQLCKIWSLSGNPS